MAMIKPASLNGHIQAGKMIFFGCVIYGVAIGSISEGASSLNVADSKILLPLNYPGIVAFLATGGVLGLLLPSILTWALIGFVPYAVARFKNAVSALE